MDLFSINACFKFIVSSFRWKWKLKTGGAHEILYYLTSTTNSKLFHVFSFTHPFKRMGVGQNLS
ncbi:hypothetical protein HMPREF1126_0439 [Streptococcus anginosus SK1138]|uniref:Uncharacterized protein n=1 Tax=Streptococcus anginosus SK1138 TaxID=1161422 RepID=A0AAD2T9Z3_STRAP|nr:hypothetical protein HMPREF1126_0439 [Streptococcus anginosus SK1138]